MCYSAQIEADYRACLKLFGADIDIKAFVELYWYLRNEPRLKLPKGMERAFADPHTDDERRVEQLKACSASPMAPGASIGSCGCRTWCARSSVRWPGGA